MLKKDSEGNGGMLSKKNQVKWNSAKVKTFRTNFLQNKNYIKRFIFILIGLLLILVKLVKMIRK
jgi:hypothetical protein